MSKRFLLLVMATLLSIFVVVGCGSDGKDGADVDSSTVSELQLLIEDLQSQLDILNESGSASEETIAELEIRIAELIAQLKEMTGTSSTASLRKDIVVSNDDLAVQLNGENIEITMSFKDESGNAFKGYNNFNTVYFLYTDTNGDVQRARIQSSNTATALPNAFSQPSEGVYKITLPANGGATTGTTLTDIQTLAAKLALDEADRDIRVLVTYTNTQTDLSDNTGWYRYYANVQKDYGTSPRDLYSEEACTSCHGGKIFNRGLSSALDADGAPRRSTRGYHFATVNGENCSVCHSYSGKNSSNPNDGGNLVTYVHGVHVSEPDSTVDVTSGVTYGISYPNNMKDCVVCHNSSERLTEVTSQKYFNYFTCMSCHQSWNSWDLVGEQVADVAFHAAYTGATDELACASCHNGGLAPTFAEFHGEGDMTATKKLGSLFRYAVDSVTIGAGTADVVWYVENPTTSDKYDLVNTDSAANPIFGALKLRIAYGKSDDWTNDTTSAQPYTAISQTSYLSSSGSGNAAVLTANGTNVWDATAKTMKTTVTLGGNSGTETIAALVFSGSPRITYNDEILAPAVPSIAYAFELADGTEHVRRKIVDDAKCLACHAKVTFHGQGTVGGDLGVQTCVVCHNPNATDKSKRASVVTLFDGKDEESYDFKVMIHRIHSATENDNPYVVYRPNIYVFFGQTLPTDWTSGTGKTANRIYYPQELTNCEACHFSGTYSEAGSKALPVTIEQNDYTDRYDDTVIGATRAACASCHTGKLLSGTDASLQAHFKVSITKSDVGTDGGCAICHNGSYAPGH